MGCVEGIPQQYNVHCGDNFERLGLLQSTICNGGLCQFESPASTGCTLSVDSVNVMGTRTTMHTDAIPNSEYILLHAYDVLHIQCDI